MSARPKRHGRGRALGHRQTKDGLEARRPDSGRYTAAVAVDGFGQTLQRPVDDFHDLFCVPSLDEFGMPGRIDGTGWSPALRRDSGTAGGGSSRHRQLRAQRGDGGVDDGVVNDATGPLLGGDGLFELLSCSSVRHLS